MRKVLWLGLLSVLVATSALAGCASDDPKEEGPPPESWTQGEFMLTAHAVDDGCLDGAAEVVAIPGADKDTAASREFTNPIQFPASDGTLPFETSVKFVAPFTEVKANFVKTEDGKYTWEPRPQNLGVDLGGLEPTWAGCVADFEFGSTWEASTTGDGDVKFVGSAEFVVLKTNGDAACPPFAGTPPCAVKLDMIATRKK